MICSVQTDEYTLLKEAAESNCKKIRYGSEFCEYKIPTVDEVERAYDEVNERGKIFTYVTPRLSNKGIEEIRKQLTILNEKGPVDIVVNDLGTLNLLKHYDKLHPHLGRQLIRIPARSPWVDSYIKEGGLFARKWFNKVFSSTSLNYSLTMELFRNKGVKNVDVDWIPRVFPSFDRLMNQGFNLSVHLHLVPITVTRRCHTARFQGEKNPEECSKPCQEKVLHIKNEVYNLEFFLHGNVVFHLEKPLQKDIEKLRQKNISEFVLTMNPITGLVSRKKIDEILLSI